MFFLYYIDIATCIHHKMCEGRCQRSWCEALHIDYTPLERVLQPVLAVTEDADRAVVAAAPDDEPAVVVAAAVERVAA